MSDVSGSGIKIATSTLKQENIGFDRLKLSVVASRDVLAPTRTWAGIVARFLFHHSRKALVV